MTIKGCIVYTYITCHRYADAARESAIEESEYFSSVSPHEESWPCVDDSCDEALYADELKEKVNGNVTWCNFELVDWYRIHLFNRKRSRFTDVIMYKPHTHALINRCHIVHSSLFNVHSQFTPPPYAHIVLKCTRSSLNHSSNCLFIQYILVSGVLNYYNQTYLRIDTQ